jgi:hypothetical protein
MLFKAMHRFNVTATKFPVASFWSSLERDKLIPKFLWRGRGPRIAKTIFKMSRVGGLTQFKNLLKAGHPGAHSCSPSYSEGRDQEDCSSKPVPGK